MTQDIGNKAAKGVAWMGSGQVIRQIVSIGTNVSLARMLSPEDFGLFALAFIAAEIGLALCHFGLGSAIVQQGVKDQKVISTCFWVSLAIGCIAGSLLLLVAPVVAGFYEHPEITILMLPLAFNLIACSTVIIPQSLLSQNLKFKQLTSAQIIGSLVSAATALLLAQQGFGVWALVAQPVAGNLCTGVLCFYFARWAPSLHFDIKDIKGLIRFSGYLFIDSITDAIGRHMHAFILGKKFDVGALGLYNMAVNITGIIIFQVSSTFVKVLFPAMSAIKDKPEQVRSMWVKTSTAIAFISFPAMAGMIAIAPDLVPVVFGEQWTDSTSILQILCVSMTIYSVLTTSTTVLMAHGLSGLVLGITIASTIAKGIAILVGAQYGLEGAAIGVAVVDISTNVIACALSCRHIKLPIWTYFKGLIPWLIYATMMCIAVMFLREQLLDLSQVTRLVCCIFLGMIIYGLIIITLARKTAIPMAQEVIARLRAK